MPRIDLAPSGDLINTWARGPAINTQGSGLIGEAEQKVGDSLTNMALDVVKTRQKAENDNFAFNKTMEDQKAIEDQAVKLQMSLPAGAAGYQDKLSSFIQDRIDNNMAEAPNQEAADLYSKSISRYAADRVITAGHYERTETASKYRQDISDASTAAASRYMDNPNYLTFKDTSEVINNQIRNGAGVNFQAGEVPDLIRKSNQQLAVGVLEGLITKERYGEASNLLKSGQDIGDSLDEKMKQHYVERVSKYVEAKQISSVGEYSRQVEDLKTAALMGRPINNNDVAGLIARASLNPKAKDDLPRWKDELNQAVQVGQDIQNIKTMPRDQWGSVKSMQEDAGPINGIKDRVQLKNQFMEAAKRFAAYQEKDPVASTLESFPALQQQHKEALSGDPAKVQSYLDALTAKQDYLKISNPKITSSQDAKYLGDMINNSSNSASAAQTIMNIKNSYGKYAPQLLSELSDERKRGGGGIDPALSVAAFMDNQSGVQSVIENVNSRNEIKKLFKNNFDKVTDDLLHASIQEQIKPISDALNMGSPAGGNVDLSDSLAQQVNLEAKKMMNNDHTMKASDAAKMAKEKIIDSNFNTISGGKSLVIAPTSGPNTANPDTVSKFMSYYSTKYGIKELDPMIPPQYIAAHGEDKQGAKDAFYENLSNTARWVTNQDHSGVILVQKLGDNIGTVIGKNGQPIEKKFSDMGKEAPKNIPNSMINLNAKNGIFDIW